MPLAWSIEPALRLIRLVVEDPYTHEAWERALRAIFADPRFAPGFSFLIDRRGATAPEAHDTRSQAAFLAAHMPQLGEARCAMVVRPDDPAGYGMCRMLEILTEERNPSLTLCTFTDIVEAEYWLSKLEP